MFSFRLWIRHISKRGCRRQSLRDPFPRNQQQNGESRQLGKSIRRARSAPFALSTYPHRGRIKRYLPSARCLQIRRWAELIFRIIEKVYLSVICI